MKKRFLFRRARIKKPHISSFIAIAFAVIGIALATWRILDSTSMDNRFKATAETPTIPVGQTVVYEAPVWAASSAALTPTEIAGRFNKVIYARNQMTALPGYVQAGYIGQAYIYLIMDSVYGPSNLSSLTAQNTPCTAAQRLVSVYSSNAAMDKGDFCEIHDAIINHTSLPDYSDIYPSESWFLHKPDGSRYVKITSSGFSKYRPNPANPEWRTYFARRSLRELAPIDVAHMPVNGVNGLFIDNVDLSWSKLLRDGGGVAPQEFSSNDAYMIAVTGFVQTVYQTLHSDGYSFPVWGNMIEDTHSGTSWNRFAPYLEGGMNESFVLSWGNGPSSTAQLQNDMIQADSWLAQGKYLVAVIQGDASESYSKYAYAITALITDGYRVSYKYANYDGTYSQYYEQPEYAYPLGLPIETRRQVSTSPLEYARNFQCGSVMVDITNHQATITMIPNCLPNQSPSPTPEPSPSPSPTISPSPTPNPSPTPSPSPSPTPKPRGKKPR